MVACPVTCVVRSEDSLGEGCLWDAAGQALWWLDIARPTRIHRFEPATGVRRVWHSDILLTAIAQRTQGGFLVAGEDALYFFDPATGALSPFVKPEADRPGNRSNDGACDPQGRFWHGTMQQNIGPSGEDMDISADTGALYRVMEDGTSALMQDHVGVSNGPCWSPDGKTFYFSDSRNQMIFAYDFDAVTGDLGQRRVFNDSRDHGYPDGATVDAEGFLWSARWEGSCVLRIDPKGRIDRIVPMPATRVTCIVFGGPDLDVAYVTTSRAHVGAEVLARYPLQGGVFCFSPGVKGLLKYAFSG